MTCATGLYKQVLNDDGDLHSLPLNILRQVGLQELGAAAPRTRWVAVEVLVGLNGALTGR
jgi:hypothetical protein